MNSEHCTVCKPCVMPHVHVAHIIHHFDKGTAVSRATEVCQGVVIGHVWEVGSLGGGGGWNNVEKVTHCV